MVGTMAAFVDMIAAFPPNSALELRARIRSDLRNYNYNSHALLIVD